MNELSLDRSTVPAAARSISSGLPRSFFEPLLSSDAQQFLSDPWYFLSNRSRAVTPADFRRIALSFDGVEEVSHAGLPAFRVGGRRFASLASQADGYGNLTLTLEQQAAFVEDAPEIFLPIPGGWGKMGHTHVRLAAVSEDVLTGALRTAWKLRVENNAKTRRNRRASASRGGVVRNRHGRR